MAQLERKKLVELRDVTKVFGSNNVTNKVLKQLSLSIYEGDFLMILGKSGSGKTTLMNIIVF